MADSHLLTLVRCRASEHGTFGRLFVDDVSECYTLEPSPVVLHPCIPLGEYPVTLDVVSPKYRYRFPYNTLCSGRVPRLLNVTGRDGILIHIGCFAKDTLGCILVGTSASLTRLYHSTNAFINLYNKIKDMKNLHVLITDIKHTSLHL